MKGKAKSTMHRKSWMLLVKDIVDPEMLHGLILKYRVMAKQGILDIHLGDGASSRGS